LSGCLVYLSVILSVGAGTDATSSFEDVGHSEDAREMQAKYLIGTIIGPKKQEPVSDPIFSFTICLDVSDVDDTLPYNG